MMAATGHLRMRGTDDIDTTVQRSTATQGTDHIRRAMVGCRWTLLPDGGGLLIEGPSASSRGDLWPLPGRWMTDGTTVAVILGLSTDSRVAVQLRGTISANGAEPGG